MSGERDPQDEILSQSSSTRWLAVLTVILLVGVLISFAYVARERENVRRLTTSNGEMREDMNRAHQELDALTAKLNALTAAPAAPTAIPASSSVIAEPVMTQPKVHRAKHVVVKHQAPDDPRWKQVQDELALHDKKLAEN